MADEFTIQTAMKNSIAKGKLLLEMKHEDVHHWLSSEFKYLHCLCGKENEAKLFNIWYTYRCPYCDEHLISPPQEVDSSIVETTLNALKFIKANRNYNKRYDDEMLTVFTLLPGWIASLEEIKDMPGTAYILSNNELLKDIDKWKEKL